MPAPFELSVVKGPQRNFTKSFIHRLLEDEIADSAHKTALIQWSEGGTEQRTTYDTLNTNANRYARSLVSIIKNHESGAQPNRDGDCIIAVCMPPSERLITILLAIWKAGAAYLPIDASFPQQRIEHILAEARPVLVIHEEYDKADADFVGTLHINAADLMQQSQGSVDNLNANETLGEGDSDLATVLYTSGSTGVPKGVRLTHSSIQNRLQWQFEAFPYSETEETCVFKTSLTFVDSVAEIWGPLMNQLAVLIIPKNVTKDPEQLVDVLHSYRIERLVLVPTLLRSLLMYLSTKNEPRLLHNLKIWVCSGEALSIQLATEFFDYFIEGQHVLCNFYGSTEIMGDVSYFVCNSKRQLINFDKVPIGHPISNTELYVMNTDAQPVALGETGELYVSGSNLALGYVDGRDKYRFVQNPITSDPMYKTLYRTGDYASVLEGGAIQYEGRTDSQIKIRGHRADLNEIERHLLAIKTIDKGVVLCYHDGEIDQALLAFVTVESSSNPLIGRQMESALSEKLPDYMVPQVIVIDTIPLLVNGKVDRQALLNMYENAGIDDSTIEMDFDFTGVPADQIPIAKNVFETIRSVVGRSVRATISASSNFYELGGNSLNSVFTVSLLRNHGYTIGITDFIAAKTLREVLDQIATGSEMCPNQNDIASRMGLRSTVMQHEHKSEVIELISGSFLRKPTLEKWLKPKVKRSDFIDFLELVFADVIEKAISFVVMDKHNRMVGASVNLDANNEPDITLENVISYVLELIDFVEGPIKKQKMPHGRNQILNTCIIGTGSTLNAQENVAVVQFMEEESMRLARRKGFAGILAANTSPLTQQLASDVNGYETLATYQVNQFVASDGTQPFRDAPDWETLLVQWKRLSEEF